MASRKENLKALFTNSRTRVIILITAALLITLVVFGVMRLRAPTQAPAPPGAVIGAPGDITSIPGIGEPSPEYSKLIRQENLRQYKQAQRTGGSAIPTLLRGDITKDAGIGVTTDSQPGIGFAALAREQNLGAQRSLWIKSLKDASCSRKAVEKVLHEGATFSVVKEACSCAELKDNGYGLDKLDQVCSCPDLRRAGFNARQFKEAGYDATRLKNCGFDACQLRNAGFTAQQLKDATFSDGELRGAGYPQGAIDKASGLPPGVSAADVRNAGCSPEALERLRQAGVSAAAITRISGCSASQLKAGGYNAGDARNAGMTAAQLRRGNYTPTELARGDYIPRAMLNAGFSPASLAGAGYTPAQIRSGEADLPPCISAENIRHGGCSNDSLEKAREAGVSATLVREYAKCSVGALKSAGYTDNDLTNADFSPKVISAATPVSDDTIKSAGCGADRLGKLLDEGVSAKKIRELNGCGANPLKEANFGAEALLAAGFNSQQLQAAGFTAQQISQAGINPISTIAQGRKSDCSVASLRAARQAGVTAKCLRSTLGCSAKALKDAGYSAKDLRNAGFTPAQLKKAGFTAAQLKNAGFTPKQLLDAGYTPAQLKKAGFTARQLKNAGLTPKQLLDAGYSPKELKDAGFGKKALKQAGISDAQLREAGFDSGPTDVAVPPPTVIPDVPTDAIPSVEAAGTDAQQPDSAVNAQLQNLMKQQQQQMADQRFDQKIQQRVSQMTSAANQAMQQWDQVSTQTYAEGEKDETSQAGAGDAGMAGAHGHSPDGAHGHHGQRALVKTGDIIFAVIDTSVNSDHPGPVLATVVSGQFKGAKLIGTFTPPTGHADKVTLTFNTLSVPGAHSSTSINAVAIDPNTARTALASRVNKHYFYRYGSLFASSFLEGFGNAFQSADTSITIGGTGGGDNITVQEGVDRSALENAVIGLATVGKQWGQVAQQNVNRMPTIEIFSGTGIGVLFTQDLASLNN